MDRIREFVISVDEKAAGRPAANRRPRTDDTRYFVRAAFQPLRFA
ncbi:MAG: hypothetical protein ACLSG5_13625 [Oscillospiraceae bacterium]